MKMSMRIQEVAGGEERLRLREQLVADARQWKKRRASTDDIILMLHEKGLSLVESVWVLQQVFGESLAKLKEVVTAHPVWAGLVRGTEPLHEELEKLASQDGQQ